MPTDIHDMSDAEFEALLGPGEELVREPASAPPVAMDDHDHVPHAQHHPAPFVMPDFKALDRVVLDIGPIENEQPVVNKFKCAGSNRTDPHTDKKVCDYKAPRAWEGACPKCQNYFGCLRINRGPNAERQVSLSADTMAKAKSLVYHSTGIKEFDRVLGGGVVPTKTLLLGAGRGAGKTTLLLQACNGYAQEGRKAYFASGEMTKEACLDYAKRLGITNSNIYLFGDPEGVDVEDLFRAVLACKATFLCLDSVQVATVADVKGDIGQVTMMDAVTNMVSSFSQAKNIASIMIGHFEKTGNYAGSEKMQHLVDGLLRMDIKFVDDGAGGRKDIGVREISWDGKSRQSKSDTTALVELTEDGIKSPSMKALKALSNLEF